jgi:gliding motility-associated-like protein
MRHALRFLTALVMLSAAGVGSMRAQDVPEFNMADTTISICIGILYDSGGEDGLYGNNENITTVIDPGGIITLTFQGIFNVENNLDFLTIYDGPNTASPLLGTFTGTTLPPTLTANSGAVTLVFTSDNSAIYAGFAIYWESDNPPPVPPALSVPNSPACNSSTVNVNFSTPVQCEWLTDAEWSVSSNGNDIGVVSAVPACVGGATNGVVLTLAEPITFNCTFDIELIIPIPDDCGLIYIFTVNTSFLQNTCGVDASISSTAFSVCPGSCANITAIVEGCLGYTFEWNEGLPPTAGPHAVCPEVTTTYTVIITENQTGETATLSFTLDVFAGGIVQDDATLCQSEPLIDLEAGVPGWWTGPGIIDEEFGLFEPDSANAGVNVIYFENQFCADSVVFTIIPIATDNITAACPGTSPFQLNAEPPGGTWDGPFTTIDGIFDPSTIGSYTLIYTTPQCTDTLIVNVDDITGVFVADSVCQSIHFDTLAFSPLGGYWTGQGIVDSLLGVFEPDEMTPGWVNLLYTINGCEQWFEVYIKEISSGPSFTSTCPAQAPMVFYGAGEPSPAGGFWTGEGLIDTATGMFDPSIVPNDYYTSIIYYAPNGCSDTTYIYNRQTEIAVSELSFCVDDDPYELIRENIDHSPHYWGEWTGPGLTNPFDDYWVFSPGAAGVGTHILTYLKNECEDSLIVTVYPSQLSVSEFSFCSSEDAMVLQPGLQSGGTWTGSGIINAQEGVFDPGVANEGSYYVYWSTPPGCSDSVYVTVELLEQAAISGLSAQYCFTSEAEVVTVVPDDAVFAGPVVNGEFIPAVAGEGDHVFIATWNGALCSSADTVMVNVFLPITTEVTVSDPVICGGAASVIEVIASGGHPDLLFTYTWSDDSFPVSTNTVSPESTTYVSVITADGCSDPAVDSVLITVLPPIEFDVITSDIQCYDELGFATAEVVTPGNFEVTWNGVLGTTIEAPAGSVHVVEIIDLAQGCTRDSLVLIPNYPPVSAAFSFNPNADCIAYADANNVAIIDLSQNAVSGTWTFGNGNTQPYEPGVNPEPDFGTSGQFTISLDVVNVGGCPDTATAVLCILPSTPIFIPDIFSPNDDGANDMLFVRSQGIVTMRFAVYSRWGELVFESFDVKKGWDGIHRGKPAPSGNYIYILTATLNDGEKVEMKGEIALIR